MLWHESMLHSFLWLNNIPFYGYTMFCLSIHQLMDTWVVSTFWLLWIVLLWMFVYKFLFEHLFSTILGIYLEVELMGHLVILRLTYWGTAKLFSTEVVPYYIPKSNSWKFQFLHTLANISENITSFRKRGGNTSQLILLGSITQILKPENDMTEKENWRPVSFMNMTQKSSLKY